MLLQAVSFNMQVIPDVSAAARLMNAVPEWTLRNKFSARTLMEFSTGVEMHTREK